MSTPGVDQVHVAAGHLHAGGQRVADRVRAGEGRQQRGVGVDHPAAERVEERGAEDLHEARGDHEVGLVRGDGVGQRDVPGGPVGVVAQRAGEGGDAAAAGVLEARRRSRSAPTATTSAG